MRRQDWEKCSKKDTSDKEGLSKIYKGSLIFYIRKQTTQLKNRPRP